MRATLLITCSPGRVEKTDLTQSGGISRKRWSLRTLRVIWQWRDTGRTKEEGTNATKKTHLKSTIYVMLPSLTLTPSRRSSSLSRSTSAFNSRINLAFGSSFTVALQSICFARSAYLNTIKVKDKTYTRQIARHLTTKDNQATSTASYITELAQDRNGWNSWSAVPKVPDKWWWWW